MLQIIYVQSIHSGVGNDVKHSRAASRAASTELIGKEKHHIDNAIHWISKS